MIKRLEQNFVQKLDEDQMLFLHAMPRYLQWYSDYRDPENFIKILRILLKEFTAWFTSCQADSYLQRSSQIDAMICRLNYFLVRPIESYNVNIFSEEFYHDYCKLVLHWSLILSSTFSCSSYTTNVKSTIHTSIQTMYNFTLHLNVLSFMKTIPNLISMLLKVTDFDHDETQLNAYRCLSKIMIEADIKTMSNPSKIAAVHMEFLTNTINDSTKAARFYSVLESLKNFVQHDQVKIELIKQEVLPVLVTTDSSQLRLYRAAEGILWKLEKENEAVAKPTILNSYKYDIMISYSHKDKELCLQIHEQLIKDGFRVWLDKDCLRGSTMAGIANAIENSEYVMICMSNMYKQSVYCQSEAHYAFERSCRLIPIIVELNYKPDGWLGIIVSGKIYVDFVKVEFGIAYEKLKNEISKQQYQTSTQSSTISEEKYQTNTMSMNTKHVELASESIV
ncbi:unnamed protein product [Rotaria sordida]|uniref:TIR domain-containing protein n=1 Tax=Rotaria sordida TaxID=392033 RepID=A0A815G0J4_9BILA|nr:unnamed protein product [Rotaria sordida]